MTYKERTYYFDHERLDVYQAAMELIILTDAIIEDLPRGRAYLADQFQRASTSVLLNIAEGAGEFSENEKIRFYRMARRSATECSGILSIIQNLGYRQLLLYCRLKGTIKVFFEFAEIHSTDAWVKKYVRRSKTLKI